MARKERELFCAARSRIAAVRAVLRWAAAAWLVVVALTACGTTTTPSAPPTSTVDAPDPLALERLRDAINSGDPQQVADSFTTDFRADLPHHPERSFTGADRVLANWTAMFAMAPDLSATVLRTATHDDELWSEWEISGTETSGAPVTFIGPVIVTTRDGLIASARFYLDRVGAPPQ